MGILSRQIGWGTESNLLWQILKQLKQLASIIFSLKAAATPKYKVFTANLYQTGGDDPQTISSGSLTIGVTYLIVDLGVGEGCDFTNVGAPNNNIGTWFIATGTTPNNWGTNIGLSYNPGVPVANVLENTIGNVWFTYAGTGNYELQSLNLFTTSKTTAIMSTPYPNGDPITPGIYSIGFAGDSAISIYTTRLTDLTQRDDYLYDTFLEVRVYN